MAQFILWLFGRVCLLVIGFLICLGAGFGIDFIIKRTADENRSCG